MKRLIESKYKSGKVITTFHNFVGFLNESNSLDKEEIKKKLNRATLWISINKGFYGELLSHINIYGSYELDPKTISTNGREIVFHPDFIASQTDKAIRFALMHEILHCVGDHINRREGRDINLWNLACDYAINPMLKDEDGIEPPKDSSGSTAFMYDEKFEGLRIEDIYEELKKIRTSLDTRTLNIINTGVVIDLEDDLPIPDPDLIIYSYGDDLEKKEEDTIDNEDEESGPTGGDEQGQTGDKGSTGSTGDGPTGGEQGTGDGPTGGEQGTGDGPTGGEQGTGDGPTGGEQGTGDGPTGGEQGTGDGPTGEPGTGDGPTGPKQPIKVKVGDRVITNDGREGIVTQIYPDGDIEINLV